MRKQFVFLYPIPEYINWEIKNGSYGYDGGKPAFRKKYEELLNRCIDLRYRQQGWQINYALFDDSRMSDIFIFHSDDRFIKVGMDFQSHTTKCGDGEYPYPNSGYILRQFGIGRPEIIRIAGFHMWDCVNKLAAMSWLTKI